MSSVALIGDSWMRQFRVESNPHFRQGLFRFNCEDYDREQTSDLRIYGYSSMTFKSWTGVQGESFINEWANHLPSLSVLHLGAVDLASDNIPELQDLTKIKREYILYVRSHISLWIAKARTYAVNKEMYDLKIKDHRWLLVEPPIWGQTFVPHTSVTPSLYAQRRLRAEASVRKNRTWNWESMNLTVVRPYIIRFEFQQNHLSREAQSLYMENLGRPMAALLCRKCATPIGTYISPDHKVLRHHGL